MQQDFQGGLERSSLAAASPRNPPAQVHWRIKGPESAWKIFFFSREERQKAFKGQIPLHTSKSFILHQINFFTKHIELPVLNVTPVLLQPLCNIPFPAHLSLRGGAGSSRAGRAPTVTTRTPRTRPGTAGDTAGRWQGQGPGRASHQLVWQLGEQKKKGKKKIKAVTVLLGLVFQKAPKSSDFSGCYLPEQKVNPVFRKALKSFI